MPIRDIFYPNRCTNRKTYQAITATWIFCVAVVWWYSPFFFLPRPGEVFTALHDLWFYQDLGIALFTSVCLNVEAIAIAAVLSLALAYAGTIAAFQPFVSFIGELRFLSFAGLGFAFTLMFRDNHELKIAVLVFMVVVFFVVSMVDVIAAIPKDQYDLAKTLRMGDWETLYEVVILGQLDQAFVVLRQTAAMSWMFVATAESMVMSGGGIGVLLTTANKRLHLAEIMAMQLIILVLGIGQDYLIGVLRNICCPYANLTRSKR